MDPILLKYLRTLTRFGIVVLFLVIIYLLFTFVFPILGKVLSYFPLLFLPFILAIALAVLIEPVVNFFEIKLRFKRNLATALSLLLVVSGLIYFLSLIVSIMIRELTGLFPLLGEYSDQAVIRFMNAVSNFRWFYVQLNLPIELQQTLQNNLQESFRLLSSFMDTSIKALTQALLMLPEAFIFLLIATVATYLIINDRALIRDFVLDWLPGTARSQTVNVVGQLFKALIGFVKAYSMLISITAILTMLAMKILGVDYILTIGMTVGLLDILPVLGPGTFFVPWILFELFTGKTRLAISLLVVYTIITVVRQSLEPKVVGDNIGLHPLATLVSLYAGLQLGGFTGLVLGPILMVFIIASYRAGIFDRFDWRKRT